MVLIQPEGEAETNVKMLQSDWDKVMAPPAAPATSSDASQPDSSTSQPDGSASDVAPPAS